MNGFGLPSFGFGSADMIVLCVLIIISGLFFSRSTHVIVLSGKTINPRGPLLVRLQGRRSGFIAWLMTLCRLQSNLTYSFFKDRIELDSDSFFGRQTKFVLVKNVSVLDVSYACLFNLLVVSLFFFISGIISYGGTGSFLYFFVFLVLSILAFFRYIQSKRYSIQICAPGFRFRIVLQISFIEGESLTMSDLEAIRQAFRYMMNPDYSEINLEEAHASVVRRPSAQSAQPFQPVSSVSPDQPAPSVSPIPSRTIPPRNVPTQNVSPQNVPPRNVPPRNVPPQNPSQFH